MAKTPTKGRSAPVAQMQPVKQRTANRLLILLTMIAFIPFSLPTLLVMFCGLLPTLVAALLERGDNRYAWICVGGLNFSGLAPWLFTLWFGHHELSYAIQEITGLTMLLTSFGAAALGWLLYLAMPPVVTTVLSATSQRRAIVLAAQQRKLVEQWGEEVVVRIEDPAREDGS